MFGSFIESSDFVFDLDECSAEIFSGFVGFGSTIAKVYSSDFQYVGWRM